MASHDKTQNMKNSFWMKIISIHNILFLLYFVFFTLVVYNSAHDTHNPSVARCHNGLLCCSKGCSSTSQEVGSHICWSKREAEVWEWAGDRGAGHRPVVLLTAARERHWQPTGRLSMTLSGGHIYICAQQMALFPRFTTWSPKRSALPAAGSYVYTRFHWWWQMFGVFGHFVHM